MRGLAGIVDAGMCLVRSNAVLHGISRRDNTRRRFMEKIEDQSVELVRLPLWRACVDAMRAEGIEYGKTYPAEYFERHLRCKRDDMKFSLAISKVRRELEKSGFYLSGRGQKGNSFIILTSDSNQNVMQNYSSIALDALKRGVILGTNTRLDTLSAEARRRHEAVLEKMATRAILFQRSDQVADVLKKGKSKLLSEC